MSYPENWTLVNVFATYLNIDGTPSTGEVSFESGQIVVIDGVTVIPGTIRAQLDETGSISVDLPSTNDPELDVTGWVYIVHERINRGDGRDDYSIFVEYDSDPIDLSLVSPVANPGPLTPLATRAQLVALEERIEDLEDTPAVVDHGALEGLADDDHPQYLNNARGDARYDELGAADAAEAAAIAAAATDATTKANAAEAAAVATAAADATAKANAAQAAAEDYADSLQMQIKYDGDGNYAYVGTAVDGAAEGSAVWQIDRLTYASGSYTVTQSASNVTWTGRAGHTYT